MMTKPIAVLADNYPQYTLFLREHEFSRKEAIYCGGPQSIMGFELSGIVKLGHEPHEHQLEQLAITRLR